MRLAQTIVILALPTCCWATGWTDYRIDLGDGYELVRAGATHTFIARNDSVVFPKDRLGADNGVIVRYATAGSYIFVENVGTRLVEPLDGNPFLEIDPSERFFYIVVKGSNESSGPFTEADFDCHPLATKFTPLAWKDRRNPHAWVSVVCLMIVFFHGSPLATMTALFLVAAVLFLAVKLFFRGKRTDSLVGVPPPPRHVGRWVAVHDFWSMEQ